MDKIDKAISEICSPLFQRWRVEAKLSDVESAIYWYRKFECKSVIETALLLNYSEISVKRKFRDAQRKIRKIII